MNKKIKSTIDTFIDTLSTQEQKKLQDDYQELLLSELVSAAMEKDNLSVRKLAKRAGISPTIVQAMRSGEKKDFTMQSFFKILKGLGSKHLMVELHGQYITLEIPRMTKK